MMGPRGTRRGPGGGREGATPGTATSSTRRGTGTGLLNVNDSFNSWPFLVQAGPEGDEPRVEGDRHPGPGEGLQPRLGDGEEQYQGGVS